MRLYTALQWVNLQGWQNNPKRGMIKALQKQDVLIVNLHADKGPLGGDDFCGYPHIYCVVNNFGGQQMIRGSAARTYTASIALVKDKDNACVGLGMISEGVECDEYLFDILSYLSVKTDVSLSFEKYIEEYFTARYQEKYPELSKAWTEVLREICCEDTDCCHRESALLCRPSLTVDRVSTWAGSCEIRKNKALHLLGEKMLARYQDLQTNESYRMDLVAVYRQSLADRGWMYVFGIQNAYQEKNVEEIKKLWKEFSTLFDMQAKLVDCDKNLNLQLYLDNAMQRGKTEEEKEWLAKSAKRLITLWGKEDGSISLHDYAAREYGDLLRYFYKPRWEAFVQSLVGSLEESQPLQEIDWYAFENAFVKEEKEYNRSVSKDLQMVCRQIAEYLRM